MAERAHDTSIEALELLRTSLILYLSNARPALALALRHAVRPGQVVTVFAGQDLEATARARQFFSDYQPSSPSMALLRDGEVVHFVHRHQIEGRSPQAIAADLTAAFDRYCGVAV